MALLVLVALVPAAATAKTKYRFGDRTLKVGKRGHDVRVLQRYLTRVGVPTDVDGAFGRGTKKSVKQFERSQLRRADGKVTRSDARALRDIVFNGGAISSSAITGGATMEEIKAAEDAPLKLGPGSRARLGADGLAIAPASAPPAVQAVIAAGNRIAKKPYIYGGGHGDWEDAGYDCSGSVSYALHGGGLLSASMPSGGFMNWGSSGPGTWITLYANTGHMYMVVAGLRFDTSGRTQTGSRWQTEMRSSAGYRVRHPKGY
ncbi:MAG: peptidoglycan-binding domain-containing protein [Solirubrobacteraceae bacterium]